MQMARTRLLEDLHARPAIRFSKICSGFQSEVKIITEHGSVLDGKNFIELLGKYAKKGQEIIVISEGKDEREALQVAMAFLKGE